VAHLHLLVGLAGALHLDVEMAGKMPAHFAQASASAGLPFSMAMPMSPWAPDRAIRPLADRRQQR
jgi:hypothetical protein